jgi:predicted Zn-dependent protease
MKRLVAGLLMIALVAPVMPRGAAAQSRSISLIRDAETEHIIRGWATPIFGAAGLDDSAVRVFLVRDRSVNAFVAAGQNIFIHTGLLTTAQRPAQVTGVIAHETGHIAGGHLVRSDDALRNASVQQIVMTVLGAVAMVGGAGQAGMAIMSGGSAFAQRDLMMYSRTQESSADQAAVTFLDRIGKTSKGLVEFLALLGGQEALLSRSQDPYIRSHPMSRERVAALEDRVMKSPYAGQKDSPEDVEALARIQAKLYAFLGEPEDALQRYPESDKSIAARYARAIAYYRMPDLNKAVPLIDELIKERPNDPYFEELKGQMLFENGRIEESIAPYRRAVALAPKEALLAVGLGQSLVGNETDNRHLDEAVAVLEKAMAMDEDNALGWQLLASAYGRQGRIGEASLASAERFLMTGALRDARLQAMRAQRELPAGSPGALRAQDLQSMIEQAMDER